MDMIKSNDVTSEIRKMLNEDFGYEEDEIVLSDYGYAFYYNQLYVNNLDIFDTDRYANLNTVIGYDIGYKAFSEIEDYLWKEECYDMMELNGCKYDKKLIKKVSKKVGVELDFTKWKQIEHGKDYFYSYYEDGKEYK